MGKATTPAEGAIKARVKVAVKAELGADFDEVEFDAAFAEAMDEAQTYDEAYSKTIELLKREDQGEPDAEEEDSGQPATEKAIRKLTNSMRSRRG